jgi:hypothetical protein
VGRKSGMLPSRTRAFHPDDAERVHVVLSREGGLTSLGLASQETVTQVSPDRAPMLTRAPNKARGRSAQLASELRVKAKGPGR